MAKVLQRKMSSRTNMQMDGAGSIKLAGITDPAVLEALKMYDTDGNGEVDGRELLAAANAYLAAKDDTKFYKTALVIASLVFLVAIGAMLGVMIAANEASKENHTVAPKGKANQPAMLMDVNNKPVTVAGRNAQTNHAGIMDMPLMSDKKLKEVKAINVPIQDPKTKRISDFGAFVTGFMRHNTESIEIYLSVKDRSIIIVKDAAGLYDTNPPQSRIADVIVSKADIARRAKDEAAKREAAKKKKENTVSGGRALAVDEACSADPDRDPCIDDGGSVRCKTLDCDGRFCEDKYPLDCTDPDALGGGVTLVHTSTHQ